MIVWGWRKRWLQLGAHGTYGCHNCGQQCPFHLALLYTCCRIYWIFGIVTSKEYYLLCSSCGKGRQIDPAQLGPHPSPDIPFMQRYGLISFMAALGLFALLDAALK